MNIRRIQTTDLVQLKDLCAEHADYEALNFNKANQEAYWESAFFGSSPKLFGWLCERDDELLGYMTATIDIATWTGQLFVYLDCLYLKVGARGHGIGQRLMHELTEFGRSKNCVEIQWQTPIDNDLGISFYRKIGASEKCKVRFSLPITQD